MNRERILGSTGAAKHVTAAIICLAFVFAWGIRHLKADPITPAEYNSIFNIYENHLVNISTLEGAIYNVATKDETHPPGYFLLLNVWSRLVGGDLFALRLLSVYFGMFALAFTYRLARHVSTSDQALDTAILLAFTAYFAFYLHEVRMYSLLAMVSAWTVWSYAKIVHSPTRLSSFSFITLCLSAAATIYVHAFGFVLLAAIGIYHLVFIPKNRQWLQVCAAMLLAGCLYLPWLPYALQMLNIRTSYATDSLAWHETILALASIYNNGLSLLAPGCAVILLLYRRRLNNSQKYIVILVALVVLVALAVNEIAPIIVARRIRYSIILAPLWSCALAIALSFLPSWKRIRFPALAIWIFAFLLYNDSLDLYLYTNSLDQNRKQIPHFQSLLYEPGIHIRKSDYVLSFQRDTQLGRKTLDFYGRQLRNWRGLIHIWNDADGNPSVQSTDTRYVDVPSMSIWNFPIWLIHNPQETNLQSMEVFATDFSNHFHSCGRFLETGNSIVDLYVKRSIPCNLLVSRQLLEIHYENGTELANILLRPLNDSLDVYFWWTNTIANQYAFSLQLLDAQGNKVAQLDDVIGGDALYQNSFGIGDLSVGEYTAMLIVYDFETLKSQPGIVLEDERQFDREVEVARLRIGA